MEHPEHAEPTRTYLAHLYGENQRYAACRATDPESFRLTSVVDYENPVREAQTMVVFTAPSGQQRRIRAFWDGGRTWRVRFSPEETGQWRCGAHREIFGSVARSGAAEEREREAISWTDYC